MRNLWCIWQISHSHIHCPMKSHFSGMTLWLFRGDYEDSWTHVAQPNNVVGQNFSPSHVLTVKCTWKLRFQLKICVLTWHHWRVTEQYKNANKFWPASAVVNKPKEMIRFHRKPKELKRKGAAFPSLSISKDHQICFSAFLFHTFICLGKNLERMSRLSVTV